MRPTLEAAIRPLNSVAGSGKMRPWLRTQPSSVGVIIALASGLACTRGLGGLSAEKGATVPTVSVPPLPLPAFAQVVDGASELDNFAATVRELGEQDARLDEEATRTLLEFARALRLAAVRVMTDATTIEEVATRLFKEEPCPR